MVNLANTKGNNTTGVHMFQRNKDGGFYICTSPDYLKRFTSVEVRSEHRGQFKGILSGAFAAIEEGAVALCVFIENVCGVPCIWEPVRKHQFSV
ncbi:hypothetical protein Z042_13620 [Chania multitudinisentens RB-25]|uniref:Uncharacterized protein n=1 Tax=Chania multitudinisentens RB-25 TaxID=1441930 RepID=W0LGC2_9GAMM|nr:hypothetical protein [Chania multitudinisentens]AHG22796.1 hypothetical protein Z042_13620 [Chania multitudinisentens RB-25]